MKKVYSSDDLVAVELRKTFLEHAGVAVRVLHAESRISGMEIPLPAELVVLSDQDFERAGALLKDFEQGRPGSANSWRCPSCGEKIETQFSDCWKCGRKRQR